MGSLVEYFESEECRKAFNRSWENSKFHYRSRFDPLTEEEYRILYEAEREGRI